MIFEDNYITGLQKNFNWIAVVSTVSYVPLYMFIENNYFVPIQICCAIVLVLNFVVIKQKWHNMAGFILTGTLSFTVFWSKYSMPEASGELLLIPIAVVLMAIFRTKLFAYIMFIVLLIMFVWLIWDEQNMGVISNYNQEYNLLIHYMNLTVIFIVSFLLVYFFWSAASKLNLSLNEKYLLIEDQKQVILAETELRITAQKEKSDIEKSRINSDLEMLAANNFMKIKVKEKIVLNLTASLKSKNTKSTIQGIIGELNTQINLEKKLVVLQDIRDESNTDFNNRLIAACGELSKTEREICFLLKLNLSNKEIASIRSTSDNSINVTKNRIRKKLKLDKNEELIAFIQQV